MGLVVGCGAVVRGTLFGLLLGGFLNASQLAGPEALEILNPVVHGFEVLRVQAMSETVPARAMVELYSRMGIYQAKKIDSVEIVPSRFD
jgi:hypothetical protein